MDRKQRKMEIPNCGHIYKLQQKRGEAVEFKRKTVDSNLLFFNCTL